MKGNNILAIAGIAFLAYYFMNKKNSIPVNNKTDFLQNSREPENYTAPVRDHSGPEPGNVRYVENRRPNVTGLKVIQ